MARQIQFCTEPAVSPKPAEHKSAYCTGPGTQQLHKPPSSYHQVDKRDLSNFFLSRMYSIKFYVQCDSSLNMFFFTKKLKKNV